MGRILFFCIMLAIPVIECFSIIPKKINSKFISVQKENTDLNSLDILEENTPEIFYLSVNKETFKIAERKHSQIAILGLITLFSSEFFLADFLNKGKGISLLTGVFDNTYLCIMAIFIIQSIHEIIFRGEFPLSEDRKIIENEKLIEKEIFIGRISMISLLSIFIYEMYYDIPFISTELKTIIKMILLYFKILFSIGSNSN